MALWWIANIIGLVVVLPLVVVLANRVISQVREVSRYADEILEHAHLLAANLDPVPELFATREEVRRVADRAVRYVTALDRMV